MMAACILSIRDKIIKGDTVSSSRQPPLFWDVLILSAQALFVLLIRHFPLASSELLMYLLLFRNVCVLQF